MSQKKRLDNALFSLREAKRDLKKRIGQSMSDRGRGGTSDKCKKLQRELAKVTQVEKKKKQKRRRLW